jgi:DNA-binding XRE family transcriptional regulator
LCNKRKNQPEVINQELAVEFEKNKRGYELPDQLRIKRKLLGLTQAHVAKQVGTFAPVVTRIEKGKLKNSIFIQRIADYLDI